MTLSVIIPGYRTPDAMWTQCLKSVLAALGDDGEVICVDDGSPVPPAPGVEDGRIRWIRLERNAGQSAARNAALDAARGAFVAFVDSDDAVLPGVHARAIAAARREGADVVAFGARAIWPRDGFAKESELPDATLGELGTRDLRRLMDLALFDTSWNKVYRRAFLERHTIRFPPGVCPGEDTMFALDCVLKGAKWATVSGIGYLYYRMDGTTLSRYQPNLVSTLEYWKRKWDEYLATRGAGFSGWWPTRDYSPDWVARQEWDNLWARGSTVPLAARWGYLRAHPALAHPCAALAFARKAVYSFLRLHAYVRPLRRWHLRRVWPTIRDLRPDDLI